MNVLVLDDLQERHDLYIKKYLYRGATLAHAYNFLEFFNIITKSPCTYDVMQLDHDLGDPTQTGDGRMAARLLAVLPENMRPNKIIVHSWNLLCAEDMLKILQDAGYKDVTYVPAGDK